MKFQSIGFGAAIAAVTVSTIAVVSVAPAQAAILSFSTAELSVGATGDSNGATPFSLAKFDSSLGTLNSVTFSFFGTATNTVGVENLATFRRNVFAVSNTRFVARAFPSITTGFDNVFNEVAGRVRQYDGTTDFAGLSGLSNTVKQAITASNSFASPTALGLFTGSGDFDGVFRAVSALFEANDENKNITNAKAIVTVSYDYTEKIPTPALLPGLIGLGVAALRKRKQQATQEVDA